ncbi:MAG: radical SAM protein [Bacillota bacterium]|nr:radical SAM protein [Bacillota bacterium]
MKRHYNIPVFVPHNGCPHDCSFCNQKRITGKYREQTGEEIRKEIEKCIPTLKENRYVEIAFFGGSFTGIEEKRQIELLNIAADFVKSGQVDGIRLSTRPDYINVHILDYLKEYGVTAIELGVQSMDDGVLRMNDRGHTSDDVRRAADIIKSYGCFELGLQQMIGLYGSTYEKDIYTAKEILSLAPETTRIYPTIVLEGTRLKILYDSGEYIPYTLEEAVDVSSKIYKMYTSGGVNVIRIGLQSTEMINETLESIAGPYHSSFGELVISRVRRDEIERQISGHSGEVIIYAPQKEISKVIGNKKSNIKYFKEKYNLDIKIIERDGNISVTFEQHT